jgi:hypothetical protein
MAALAACLIFALPLPASSRAPPRSPEEQQRDAALFMRASVAITPKVMQCFRRPAEGVFQPFKVRFFVVGADRRPAQLKIVEEGTSGRDARSRTERAAIRAVKECAPYRVPPELQNWGFPAQVEFK